MICARRNVLRYRHNSHRTRVVGYVRFIGNFLGRVWSSCGSEGRTKTKRNKKITDRIHIITRFFYTYSERLENGGEKKKQRNLNVQINHSTANVSRYQDTVTF